MTLNPNSPLVKWTYFLRETETHYKYTGEGIEVEQARVPRVTTLCRFFWRAFVFMPLFWLLISSAVLGLVYGVLYFAWTYTTVALSVVLGTVALGLFLFYLQKHSSKIDLITSNACDLVMESTFVQGLKTVKGKFCPIITFEGVD